MNNPRSETIFHFTKKLDYLKSILKNGFFPRFCLEDVEWMESKDDNLAYPIVCFCDIPLSRITEHTSYYGKYGLGLTKEWAIKNNLSPVLYFSDKNAHLPQLANFLLEQSKKDLNNTVLLENTYSLLKLMKPISGKMKDSSSGTIDEKDFYQESEWRYAAPSDELLKDSEDFEELRDKANKSAEEYSLKFTSSDVKYIFISDDAEIIQLCNFIDNNMKELMTDEIEILKTKIISLKTIMNDM